VSLIRRLPAGEPSLIWAAVAVIVVYLVAVYCSLRGVNFGNHPDEWHVIKSIENSFHDGIFLQRWYGWGSLGYDIGAATAMLAYLIHPAAHASILKSFSAEAVSPVGYFAQHSHFNLMVRLICAVVSLTVILPTAHLPWLLTRRAWPSILSAIVVGFSFQLNYHSRWYTGDAPLMMFGFAAVYLSIIHYRSVGRSGYGWLVGAAMSAAFAASAKYTGAMFLMAPLLAAVLKGAIGSPTATPNIRLTLLRLAIDWFVCGLAFALTFVALNPACVIEPFAFIADVKHVQQLYAHGAHTNQDVTSRPENVLLSLLFVFLLAPSQYFVLSLIILALFWLGFMRPRHRIGEMMLLVVPFALFFALLAWQQVFVARNLAVMIPFLAVMCGLGAAWLSDSWPGYRQALPLLCLVFAVANGSYIWRSAAGVKHPQSPEGYQAQMADYIAQHPDQTFSIFETIKYSKILSLPNTKPFADAASMGDFVAIDSDAYRAWVGPEHRHCSTNRPGLYTWFGPRDSSFEYYTGMIGIERYILVDRQTAQQTLNQTPMNRSVCWPLMKFRWVY
jgi:hypothetical protein